jgi:serine/threonine protein phosphatase PrpC
MTPSKPNQDRMLMVRDTATGSLVFACLDGHGVNGHKIAQFFKEELEAKLCIHPFFATDLIRCLRSLLQEIEYALYRQETRLGDYSGTTLCLIIIRNQEVTICNIGDSKVVLGRSSGQVSAYEAQELSFDHKPDLVCEHTRIIASGGRVFAVRYQDGTVGPPRVWLGHLNAPGLAMSRSLGDFVVHTAGVVSTPDISTYPIHEDSIFVLATDGLWDMINPTEAVASITMRDGITMRGGSPIMRSVDELIAEASRRWKKKGKRRDDITAIVVHVGSGSGGSAAAAPGSTAD